MVAISRIFERQVLHDLIDQVFEDHVAHVDFDLGLLKLIVQPLVLSLHDLAGKHLSEASFARLLKDLLVELFHGRDRSGTPSSHEEHL